MKIIISHDVDHLYPKEHWKHDLIILKLWIRSGIHLLKGKIKARTFIYRLFVYPYVNQWNHTQEILEYDKRHGISSTFFFGMNKGLGMSYRIKDAKPLIKSVIEQGYEVGVHGISYQDIRYMYKEYVSFRRIIGKDKFGIRMHYVRKDKNTIRELDRIGYSYDSTEFDKSGLNVCGPYILDKGMWEIPLHIMDGYVIEVGDIEKSKENTLKLLEKCKRSNLPYCTILFHDYYFDSKAYPQERAWYKWLIEYLVSSGFEFISFKQAVEELNGENQ